MAILFNPQALNAFAKFNVGNNNAIANLGEGNGLVQNEKLGFILTRKFRSGFLSHGISSNEHMAVTFTL